MTPRKKAVLTIILGVALIIGFINYSISCGRTITKHVSNLSGTKILVQYDLNCGFLAGSTNLVLLNSPYQTYWLNFFNPIYVAEFDYEKSTTAVWLDDQTVQVKASKNNKTYRMADEVGSIKFVYVSSSSP